MASHVPTTNWADPDLSEAISLFKQKMTLYLEDEEIAYEAKQARKICRGIGDERLKRLNASGLSDADKKRPTKLWEFYKGQLKLNVKFRIHRLHLMQYRQKPDESIDDFVTRARTLAQKCQFTDEELNERLIELIIASTPHDALRNYLYSKPKGHLLADVLTEGRKYEALSAGNEQLHQMGMSHGENIHAMDRGQTCQNCGRSHKPRQCPVHIMMNALHAASEATGRNAAGKAGNRDSNALDEAKEASLPHHNTDMIDSGAPGNTTNSGASPTSIP